MADTTRPAPAATGQRVSGYCRGDAHWVCTPGPVYTYYGDLALTIRCDCDCHRKAAAR